MENLLENTSSHFPFLFQTTLVLEEPAVPTDDSPFQDEAGGKRGNGTGEEVVRLRIIPVLHPLCHRQDRGDSGPKFQGKMWGLLWVITHKHSRFK